MNILHRQCPRKLLRAGFAWIAALAVLGPAAAAAQDCFFVHCQDRPPGYVPQPQPDWQGDPWDRGGWQQRGPQWQQGDPGWQQDPRWQEGDPDEWEGEPDWQPPPPPWHEPPPNPYGAPYWRREPPPYTREDLTYLRIYAAPAGERFPVPALRLSDVHPAFLRRSVHYPTSEAAGTIVIDPQQHFLYFVQGGGRAIRYGVGVGRAGFGWSGVATIHHKQAWPDWYPPRQMIARQPEIWRVVTDLPGGLGMPGGPRNPLGARALYLWQGDRDTLFRIHGTVEPWTIGSNVSSGCIRMINQDVIDLYRRVPIGAKVVVLATRQTTALR